MIRTLTPIALVHAEEWKAIVKYCMDEVAAHNYECPDDNTIVIWTTHDGITDAPSMHGAYNSELSQQTPDHVNVVWLTGNCDYPEGFSWEGNWSPHMARTHFIHLFETVIGKKYAGSRSENRG